jgi:DNA polymerase-3 subunit epsilon
MHLCCNKKAIFQPIWRPILRKMLLPLRISISKNMPYLVLDLEMTGTEAGFHDIIQIGAVLLNDEWEEIGTYLSNVYPANFDGISEEAEEVHGISIYDLEDAPPLHEVLENFEEWIRKKLRRAKHERINDITVCGQSVMNDINFLKEAYRNENVRWPFAYKLIDLLTITYFVSKLLEANKKPAPKSMSLGNVASFFGMHREEAQHNALEDAQLTAACFKKYFALPFKLS